jgi:mannose-6-phosphate isomerase class I
VYDRLPYIPVGPGSECSIGWPDVAHRIQTHLAGQKSILCVECYPGVFEDEILHELAPFLRPSLVIETRKLFRDPTEINAMIAGHLTDDPVFGHMNTVEIAEFFHTDKLSSAREELQACAYGLVLVVGTGAALVSGQAGTLVFADLPRWEIQLRQRRKQIGNLGAENLDDSPSAKYKRAFFVDWRAADRWKQHLFPRIDFLLDSNQAGVPKMISGNAYRGALKHCVTRPFRVVPFFDPGPWGGHWMERVCNLPDDGAPNHAWCFDCVPEENSLLLGFGDAQLEIPAINLVFAHGRELLGQHVFARFGAEFPIRFDFLDTMGGGNLSFQVHPLTTYIREKFGVNYTQDESYYLLDAADDGCVYLGLKTGIQPEEMIRDLQIAQAGGASFAAGKYANVFAAAKHDHFLIPAGTVHCSGKNSMVLEISATPYIFTFKLWDWGRLGLDGKPRPIHLEHGIANIQWDRTTEWVKDSLVNQFEQVATGPDWREERTGLHEFEFIETRRHWFTGTVPHDTQGGVNVLNLVEGAQAVIESPRGAFAPFEMHYAETFIVPAQVGSYTIRPHGPSAGKQCATIKAFVRKNHTT